MTIADDPDFYGPEREAVFSVISWMDKEFSEGRFNEVGAVLLDLDPDLMEPAVIVAALNHAHVAYSRGDLEDEVFRRFYRRANITLMEKVGVVRARKLTVNRRPKERGLPDE